MIIKSLKTVLDANNQLTDFQDLSLDFNLVDSFQNDFVITDVPQALSLPETEEPVFVRPDAPVEPEAPATVEAPVAPEAPVDIAPEAPADVFPLEVVQLESVSVPNDYVVGLGQVTDANAESFYSVPAIDNVLAESVEIEAESTLVSVQLQSVSVPNNIVASEQITEANWESSITIPATEVAEALPEAQVAFDVVPPAPTEPVVIVPELPVEDIPVDNVDVAVVTEISPEEVVIVADAPVQQFVEIAATPIYITPEQPIDSIKDDVINFAKGDPAEAQPEPIYCYFNFAKEDALQFSIASKGEAFAVESYTEVYSVRNDNDSIDLVKVELVGTAQADVACEVVL